MLKYANFLFSIIVKKKGLYFSFLLLCITFLILFVPTISEANNDKVQGILPIDTFSKWFPFVFSTIFSSLLITRIFKTGEKDGTELLISAKPITRKKIVFAKFLVMYTMIFVFHIFLFSFYLAITQIDKNATQNQKLRYATSMAIGGFIVAIMLSSIIVVFSSFMGKVATVVSGILIAAIIPVLSFTIVPISNAISPSEAGKFAGVSNDIPRYFLSTTQKTNSIYDPSKQNTNGEGISFFNDFDFKAIKNNKNTWYQYAKYLDLWYQWERFFSLLEPTVKIKKIFSYRIMHVNYDEVDSRSFDAIMNEAKKISIKYYSNNIDLNNDYNEYIGLFHKDELDYEKNKLQFDNTKYNNLTKKKGSLHRVLSNITSGINIIDNRYSKEEAMVQKIDYIRKELIKEFGIKNKMGIKYFRILLWRAIHDFQISNLVTESNFKILNLISISWVWDMLVRDYFYSKKTLAFNINDQKNDYFNHIKLITNYKEKKYFETTPIIIVWSILVVILVVLSIVIYLKRDFK